MFTMCTICVCPGHTNSNHKTETTPESFYCIQGDYSNKSIFTPISSLGIRQGIAILSLGFDQTSMFQ